MFALQSPRLQGIQPPCLQTTTVNASELLAVPAVEKHFIMQYIYRIYALIFSADILHP